ncbi:MAG: PHP domain-containing protein, partial [Caldilineaceae bacterium]
MFTHLHVHSHYSLLAATPSIDELVTAATANQMDYLALTDHNALYGVVEFCAACSKVGIQPIVGMTLNVQLPQAQTENTPEPFVLLAANHAGYQSLCRLSSIIQASPEREQRAQQGVSWEELKANHGGVIAIAGGRRSWLQRWLAASDTKSANTFLGRFAGMFEEQGYLALELHTASDQAIAQQVNRLAQRFGLPVVAVQPVYTLLPAERHRLRLLAAIDRNCRLEEVSATALPDDNEPAVELHWLSPEEIQQRFAAFPQAIGNVDQLLASCEPALPSGKPIFPMLKLAEGVSTNDELTNLAHQGIDRLYHSEPMESGLSSTEWNSTDANPLAKASQSIDRLILLQRLQDELSIIARAGYAPLFLVVADIVRFARSRGIPVSTRGSVANSLVAYATGITTVDPIANNLLFERFLNPERGSPPDIDLDFCSERRDEVLEYVRHTYGEDRVALVATVSTMRPRSAIGETAKAYGLNEEAA